MIARVTLELALGKEFDYIIPDEMAGLVEIGTRVKVPFAHRQVLACVTALPESSPHANLRPIIKIIGAQSFVSPKVLQLARWMAEYYCCPREIALKTVLPEVVRKEKSGWREQLFVRALPDPEATPKLSAHQAEVLKLVRQRNELPLQEILQAADTTTQTLRRLEDKGLIAIAPKISERDPYEREKIVASQSLAFNADQQKAFEAITAAMSGGTGVPPVDFGVPPKSSSQTGGGIGRDAQSGQAGGLFHPITETTASRRLLPHFEIPGSTYHVTWKTVECVKLSDEAQGKALAACRFWHGKKMKCYLACVMPDHVHLLLQPLPIQERGKSGVYSLTEILRSIKSFSAHEINKVMDLRGPVWQQESYDRMIRSETDLHEKWNYIWNNPRELGIAGPLEDYPFIWAPGGTGVPPVDFGVPPKSSSTSGGGIGRDAQSGQAGDLFHPGVFLRVSLHGVTGSGKTEVYLQAIAHSLRTGQGRDCACAGNIVDTANGGAFQGPVQFRAAANAGGGVAQPFVRGRAARRMAQNPPGARPHRHRGAVGRFCAGGPAGIDHRGRGARAFLQAGGSAALPCPRRGRGARTHGECGGGAGLGHAVDGKFLQRATAANTGCWNCRFAPITKKCRSFASSTCGKSRGTKRPPRSSRRNSRKPSTSGWIAANKRFCSSTVAVLPPRCNALCAAMWRKCPNCSLSLTYHRQAARLRCHICGHEQVAPAVCPDPKCRNPAIRFSGLGTEKVEDDAGQTVSQGPHPADGFGHIETQGGLPAHPWAISRPGKSTCSWARR